MAISTEQKEKRAFERIKNLKQLSIRLNNSSDESTSIEIPKLEFTATEATYKRKGIELKKFPHSSEKIAKAFDDRI